MAITLNIVDHVTPSLESVAKAFTPRTLNAAIGTAEKKLFQSHFIHAPQNRLGYPTTHFWADAARSTSASALPDGVLVTVAKQGVRQRLEGGDIFPVNKKYLAIPAREETYGKTPGEFDNLKVAYRRRGGVVEAFALVEADATKITRGKKADDFSAEDVGGLVFFWLVKSVTQRPDPTVIPDERDIRAEAYAAVNELVERAARKSGGGLS